MRTLAVLLSALFAGALAVADTPCQAPGNMADLISSKSKPLPPARFSKITNKMTVTEILSRLGPAARDRGSGVYVFEWDTTDGRTFRLSFAGLCDRPFGFGFAPK
jgi:hypothetical protein